MTDHCLLREAVETRQYILEYDDGELIENGGGELIDLETRSTIECVCGERFRKEGAALAHLEKVGVLSNTGGERDE